MFEFLWNAVGFFLVMIVLVFVAWFFMGFVKVLITTLIDLYKHEKERRHNTDPDKR